MLFLYLVNKIKAIKMKIRIDKKLPFSFFGSFEYGLTVFLNFFFCLLLYLARWCIIFISV